MKNFVTKWQFLSAIILLLLFIIVGENIYFFKIRKEPALECPVCEEKVVEETESKPKGETKEIKKINVEVKGNVLKPGVYNISEDKIINDVIKLAGGFNKLAYTNNINLSKKVSDELVIFVYSKNEMNKTKSNINTCPVKSYDIGECVNKNTSMIVKSDENGENKKSVSEQKKIVNINTASLSELMTLSGIGESKAKNIISYRTENGDFKKVEDIKKVSGIGDSLYAKIKDNISI
jgi:competence protein ComEA